MHSSISRNRLSMMITSSFSRRLELVFSDQQRDQRVDLAADDLGRRLSQYFGARIRVLGGQGNDALARGLRELGRIFPYSRKEGVEVQVARQDRAIAEIVHRLLDGLAHDLQILGVERLV